jgi:adenylate cyclase
MVVQRAGERLRLTARLTDSETGQQIWSRRYDRRTGDIFEVQDELAREIVTAIEPQISLAEQRRARERRVDDLDAWELSQRALWHIRRATDRDYAEARRLLEHAVERAPTYGYPRSLLAFCLCYQAVFGWTRDPPGAFGSVLAAASEAVHADDSDRLAHALLGIAHLWTSGSL